MHREDQQDARRRAARRAAMDHVLGLIAQAPWSAGLVLRGSVPLRAWLGGLAREPGDLDWVMLEPSPASFPDPLGPYPYVDDLSAVQQWPEAAHGVGTPGFWADEESGTHGARPVLPPEGLRWVDAGEYEHPSGPYDDLMAAIREHPTAYGGVVLDAEGCREDGDWTYREYENPGVRIIVPWHAEGLEPGTVQLDFASDETLPEAPVWTAVPRGDGGPPTPVRTASPALSLAWKLLWLCTDGEEGESVGAKDLFDAVLLAESPRTRLTPRLLRKVLGRERTDRLGLDTVRSWRVDPADWRALDNEPDGAGDTEEWRERLARALAPLLEAPSGQTSAGQTPAGQTRAGQAPSG
ncbi:nucleotidyl transferase AbiEii/AbiGii toxin family protein [Streptomyces sp. NBC_00872]|uniref:nucleotidyl transferase AbiEii/AbiGii toxin family protein n=1 Tax=Streptomyces sp. NBC_00872 TaxID=2903686 RepID=UPI0038681181|nr:nucleotidyl transferase AbiEii/AbiGii toxin family protein [Streptomyces sp. NBC_00872]